MGNKQSTTKSTAMPHLLSQADLKRIEYENELYYQQRARRASRPLQHQQQQQQLGLNSQNSMKRTVSTPFMAMDNPALNPNSTRPSNNNNNNITRPSIARRDDAPIQQLTHPPQYLMAQKLKKNPSTIIELNNQLKSKQSDLTTAIKRLDSVAGAAAAAAAVATGPHHQPSQHLSSKLYKPNASMLHATLQSNHNNHVVKSRPIVEQQQQPKRDPVPIKNSENTLNSSSKMALSNKNSRNSRSSDMSGSSDGFTNKLGKKFGLSPKFKRKIVETIANRVNGGGGNNNNNNQTANNQKNSLFAQSRLLQALQSQWNLFTSLDENGSNNNNGYNSLPRNKQRRQSNNQQNNTGQHTTSSSTFLSISMERNSFRYASRRKYKTQSLANPYRHADTNYPVYTHEALFMPEFSVKGSVTEADFEIIDVISRGAFGHVIKVRMKKNQLDAVDGEQQTTTTGDQQIYAMKIMWKSQVIRDRALQQVKDEVTIAVACVDNPLIVKTWFYWQSKRFLYIITDFIENGELLSLWLRVHHFPERVVACYAVEMSLALDYLHRRGIIYRDIKMENILLDKRGHVQLIDFGLSKWLAQGERTCTICGTIQYMAPEILSVEPYDHSVDWWSLGILIYALLSGEYPLNAAKDHIQMNERVSRHVFELERATGGGSNKYSGEACDLVRRLLRKNPHRRLRSLTDCKKDGFFLKEMQLFINRDLVEKKKTTSAQEKENLTLLVKENYWNPYFILENYSPLELLFEELSGYSPTTTSPTTDNLANSLKSSDTNPVKTVSTNHNNNNNIQSPIEVENSNFVKSKHHNHHTTESSTTTNTTNSSSEISSAQREMTERPKPTPPPLSSRHKKESTTTTTTTSSSEDEQSSSGQNNSGEVEEESESRSEYEMENSMEDDDVEVIDYHETDNLPQSTRDNTDNNSNNGPNEYHHHHFHHHYKHHHHHYDHNQSQV